MSRWQYVGVHLGEEQAAIDAMYARVDVLRERVADDLHRLRSGPSAGTPAAVTEREAFERMYSERIKALDAAEERLCFGRLDGADDSIRYIGRMGLSDDDQQPILTDWRAPAAEPFYQATAAQPCGIVRRRHIMTHGRTVTALEDDVLDLDAIGDDVEVQGGGALMAALSSKRTGRMREIVSTIQSEQDAIIRSPLKGILVVEGGPGCGKTVVALHRAAFLLYTHRDRLARGGVLVVGPNPLFLRYIEQVLPALGETSAVLATPGTLLPGFIATAIDDDATAGVKGRISMAEVMSKAVRDRQRIPEKTLRLNVEGTIIDMTPAMVSSARDRARSSRKPHNEARKTFVLSLLDRLANVLADALGVDPSSNRDYLIADLRESRDVRREVNLAWMPLTPQQVLSDLYSRPKLLESAAPRMSLEHRRLLRRHAGAEWTTSDVPLLDELAELLGEDNEEQQRIEAIAARERRSEVEYAKSVLEMTGTGEGLTADALVDRYSASRTRLSVAEAAANDRTWAYGHVVVDEAQELSPMAWRAIMRRCPNRSMTIVGDLNQNGSSAGVTSWDDVFPLYTKNPWRVERLTVNYRTPAPAMELAESVLAANGGPTVKTIAARDGQAPLIIAMDRDHDADALAEAVGALLDQHPEGRIGVLTSRRDQQWAHESLHRLLPDGLLGQGLDTMDHQVSVLSVTSGKGLEFDAAIVWEPLAILDESTRGVGDLYVALTRATTTLVVMHALPLPPGF